VVATCLPAGSAASAPSEYRVHRRGGVWAGGDPDPAGRRTRVSPRRARDSGANQRGSVRIQRDRDDRNVAVAIAGIAHGQESKGIVRRRRSHPRTALSGAEVPGARVAVRAARPRSDCSDSADPCRTSRPVKVQLLEGQLGASRRSRQRRARIEAAVSTRRHQGGSAWCETAVPIFAPPGEARRPRGTRGHVALRGSMRVAAIASNSRSAVTGVNAGDLARNTKSNGSSVRYLL
jgi:hypothetical protein